MNRQGTAIPAELLKELEDTLYRRITGPMPNYYRGVRLFWLGSYNRASYAFENYLRMLPKNGAVSRAQSLLKRVRQLNENELKRAF